MITFQSIGRSRSLDKSHSANYGASSKGLRMSGVKAWEIFLGNREQTGMVLLVL